MGGTVKVRITYLDDQPITHALAEHTLPPDRIWCARGYAFLPRELAARLGPADTEVEIYGMRFPAWSLETPRVLN